MIRFGLLLSALERAESAGESITDEAAAVEALGKKARLVRGSLSNLKVTHEDDLALAAYYLKEQFACA